LPAVPFITTAISAQERWLDNLSAEFQTETLPDSGALSRLAVDCPNFGACAYRDFADAPAKKFDGDDVRHSEGKKPLHVPPYRMTVKELFVTEERLGVRRNPI
jgi:hypothetical protein